jgi:GntR family transcriptional regulator / MocR family aminotransferase
MPKSISAFELTLESRPRHQTLSQWLYAQLRLAIIERRLKDGTRLPASRDFAKQYGISRGTVVNVFERLQSEGYVSALVGSGTRVNQIKPLASVSTVRTRTPVYIQNALTNYQRPKPWIGLTATSEIHPFSMRYPALTEFPAALWAGIASRRARNFPSWLTTLDDGRGYRPLRQAISEYLNTSRGVRCSADQVVIVSGIQQALDLLARFLIKPGDPVWIEDPAYFGASIAFNNVGAKLIPVPVDNHGLSVSAGKRAFSSAKGVYVTPGHQFPLGMTMSLDRRLDLLAWAAQTGAFVIEDDYDSEYRFEGQPVPALQSLDRNSNVIFVGSFNKLLFPSLGIGYLVLPPSLVDLFLAFRYRTSFHHLNADQPVLADFIADGHLGRHLRRMRDLYSGRLSALIEAGKRYLAGIVEISEVRAGLYTAALLKNGTTSWQGEEAAQASGVEAIAIDRYSLERSDPNGVLLGFASFNELEIRTGIKRLARGLGQQSFLRPKRARSISG